MTLARLLISSVAALAVLSPAAAAQVTPATPDHVVSDNVEAIGSFKLAGDGVGARIVGNTMFITSTTHLSVLDISDAENPEMLGALTMDVEFENEDVPTNGKILGISASLFGVNCATPSAGGDGCLNLYDVSNPAAPTLIKSVMDAGQHTHDCVLDCTYFYGSEGLIVDARDPANAEIAGDWRKAVEDQGVEFLGSPHDVTEVAPGYVVTSTQPILLLSLRPEEGGSPLNPVVLAQGVNDDGRFIHSATWPRKGRDKFMLIGGETVLDAQQCTDQSAAFMTWDSSKVVNPTGGYNKGSSWLILDEVRPQNGSFQDGWAPANYFGCSVHWFAEHPTFRNGGVVAVSAYEHGTRLFQVTPDGKLTEQGFALPVGGAASAPHWHPEGKVFYSIDYQRGVDIWRYTGDTFQGPPDAAVDKPSTTPGGPEALQLKVSPRKTTTKSFLKSGLSVVVECSRTCDLRASTSVDKATARKYKLGSSTVIARGVKKGTTKSTLRVKLTKNAASKLRKAKRLTVKLLVTAKAADGRSAKATRTLRLR